MIVMDYSYQPRRDILCIDVKSFFASVESVKETNPSFRIQYRRDEQSGFRGRLSFSRFAKSEARIRYSNRFQTL